MDPNCLFCKIIAGEIPSQTVYQDDQVMAFNDIHPQAPVHILVIPKLHLPGIDRATGEHDRLLGRLLLTAQKLAQEKNLDSGYRLVINNGSDAGQAVSHLHVHLIGGRRLAWPPG